MVKHFHLVLSPQDAALLRKRAAEKYCGKLSMAIATLLREDAARPRNKNR